MAATCACSRILRPLLLIALLAALVQREAFAAHGPSPVSIVAAVFRGSGCRDPDDVQLRSRLDETGGTLRVAFTAPFAAVAGSSGRMARLACNGLIPLAIEPGKRIGITQIRIAGNVQLPSATSTALLTTEFFFPGARGPSTQQRFRPGDRSHDFELNEPTGTIWSRCGGRQTLRMNAALLASGADTEISMLDGHGLGDGIEYEVTVRDCVADPRREL